MSNLLRIKNSISQYEKMTIQEQSSIQRLNKNDLQQLYFHIRNKFDKLLEFIDMNNYTIHNLIKNDMNDDCYSYDINEDNNVYSFDYEIK